MASHGEQQNAPSGGGSEPTQGEGEAARGADDVAGREFRTSFRGYDAGQVRGYLRTVAGRVSDLEARIETLRAEVSTLEAREPTFADLDSSQLAGAVGQETARVLEAARGAAAEIRSNGEENVGRLLRETRDEATTIREEADETRRRAQADSETLRAEAEAAAESIRSSGQADADRMRAEAGEVLGIKTAEAEAVAAELTGEATELHAQAQRLESDTRDQTERLRFEAQEAAGQTRADAQAAADLTLSEADAEATAVRSGAEREAATTREDTQSEVVAIRLAAETDAESTQAEARAEADAILAEARDTGREMVHEAQLVRERMLRDLARRRKQARNQLDQLRAGRDRLLEAYARVRTDLDDVTQELGVAVTEARVAADAVSSVDEEASDTDVAELEADIEAARLIGHPLLASEDRAGDQEPEAAPDDLEDRADDAEHSEETQEEYPDKELDDSAVEAGESDLADEPDPVDEDDLDVPELDDDDLDFGDEEDGDIDALFARIRASRTEAVEDAHDVLAEEGEEVREGEEDTAEDDAVEDEDTAEEDTVGDEVVDSSATIDGVIAARDDLMAEVTPGLARRLKRSLADDQNEILDTLRRHTRGALRIEAVLPDKARQKQAYADTAVDVIVQVSKAGAEQVGGRAGPVKEILDDLSAQITEPLRARIADIVAENADDAEEASSRVRSLFREWRSQVIDSVTSDALLAAFSLGAYDATPDGALVRWVIVDEACPDAHDNVLAGDLVRGELFPTGQCRGPAHPGCRCLSWPVDQLGESGVEEGATN
ncbi:MAG: DivIVA domain-containing protein [Actinomycetia bacterium]|nr:DivIVA domain-containing protein [Actinomycetes bacterium]